MERFAFTSDGGVTTEEKMKLGYSFQKVQFLSVQMKIGFQIKGLTISQ